MDVPYLLAIYILLFSFLGALRGRNREVLITFSLAASLAVNLVLRRYVPLVRDLPAESTSWFWIQTIILLTLIYFGYQADQLALIKPPTKNYRLYGFMLGCLNGYLASGSIIYYNHIANYPYPNVISAPIDLRMSQVVNSLMAYMPSRLFGEPLIYFVVIALLIAVIVIYI